VEPAALNSGYVYRAEVGGDGAGQTVLAFHVARFTHSPPEVWRDHVAAGRVLLNGRTTQADAVLRTGDRLEYRRPAWEEPEAPTAFDVAHEDDHVIAVVKPSGLQVLPAGRFLERTLLFAVRRAGPGRDAWSPLHRIGRGTSGLVLFGKTGLARAALTADWKAHRVGKLYLAEVTRADLPATLAVRTPIGRLPWLGRHVWAASASGKPSLTRVRVLRRDPVRAVALVAAVPITGRPDQIRIHLAAAGAPLVGDPLFGPGGIPRGHARPGDIGYRLHSARLRFRHPATGRVVRVRCPVPEWVARWGVA
jgi:23S rRNA pseudouridine1911/1915/1917 synthase